MSDNGTQFISEKFQNFCLSQGISHSRCPLFYPCSNGQAERFVDTFKRGLSKIQSEGRIADQLPIFLQYYRSTSNPNVPNKVSPAEALLGRPICTILDLLKPSAHINVDLTQHLKSQSQEAQYNRRHGVAQRIG